MALDFSVWQAANLLIGALLLGYYTPDGRLSSSVRDWAGSVIISLGSFTQPGLLVPWSIGGDVPPELPPRLSLLTRK
jgi:hypothetical protein